MKKATVKYDDDDVEVLNFGNEEWRFCSGLCLAESVLLTSWLSKFYTRMLEFLGNKPFMRHKATVSLQLALSNAHDYEGAEFRKTVECVFVADAPANANGISSQVIHKTKINNGRTLKLKARLALH